MAALTWQEPPKQGHGVWVERLEPLKKRPGKWAIVYETESVTHAHQIAARLRKRVYVPPKGIWRFKSRMTENGGQVFACYVGKENAAASAKAA